MLSASVIAGLNHLLGQADWARRRLREHEGAVAEVALGGTVLRLGIGADGYFQAAPDDTAPSVTISLPPAAVARLPDGVGAVMAEVKISGQADLADTLSFVFRHLRWDGEADLARMLGPIIGRRVHLTASRLAHALPDAGTRLVANASEYLAHEGQLLVPRAALSAHAERLRQVRDTMSRLDKRIKRLATPTSARA
ncbi:MAG: hypothetical protein DWQ11_09305 [Proteobacteria bacterium]|nr:MAG: hypothetical protein DWQ11_09305 [Pseudomonadota bacterium]